MNVFFINYGCKVNQYETESMREAFVRNGARETESAESADVIVINSCTVTASGDSRSLRGLKRARLSAPDAVIVLTGCLPQASPERLEDFSDADIITGTKNRKNIPLLVERFIKDRKRLVSIDGYKPSDRFERLSLTGCRGRTRAFVKIQDGCDRFCSYCMIPYARGRSRSKPIEDIREEVKTLAGNGYREIVLVGINLAFYGSDDGLRLADAAEVCCRTEGVDRVRLGSLEPEVITDSDLDRLALQEKFCPQFHLSLQSGCDRILRAMNRRYDTAEYSELVGRIRQRFPDCAVTTDIMVGFPGETEEDFAETVSFALKTGFAKIHVFPYSVRPGTAAEKMKGQLPERVKTERMKRLREVGDRLSESFCRGMIGRTFPVLFERESDPDHHVGHTPNYVKVKVYEKNFKKSLKREIFCVKIIDSEKYCCYGEIV